MCWNQFRKGTPLLYTHLEKPTCVSTAPVLQVNIWQQILEFEPFLRFGKPMWLLWSWCRGDALPICEGVSDQMPDLAILAIWVRSSHFNFDKPERMVLPERETGRDVARSWQREAAELPCCGNPSNPPGFSTCHPILKFSKPKMAIGSTRDAAKDGMGQRELT